MSSPPLLEVIDLTVTFGGVHAIEAVSFSVPEGAIVGLIGPNGAGKTTCIDALSGFVPIRDGRILLDGHDIGAWPAHRRANNGLVRTFQSVELFDDLTVRENLLVAATEEKWWSPFVHAIRGSRSSQVDVDWVLDVVGLGDCADEHPNELGHGRRRLAGLARALASRPRLVLLDEPAAGLDTFESELLAQRLRSLPALGVSMLLIDHDMSLVHSTCETIHVLDFGQLISSGTPDEVKSDPVVIEAYLGQEEMR